MVSVGTIIGVLMGGYGFATTFTPINRYIQYGMNRLWPNAELEVLDLVELYFRGIVREDELKDRLRTHGLDHSKAIELLRLNKRVFTIDQAIYLYRRGFITDEELDQILKANHVDPGDKELYLKLTEYFPGPADIIRFAVREVFTPEVIEKYRMNEDLPEEYLKLARQAGIPELVARWYWYAHWDLPSLTMGFEMFRRKIITEDELKTLMRTLDIMPGWRDKLMQLAYEIPTRVDVRRMYELGVIDRDKVKEYYEKMGYTPEDAELLTRWTEVEYVAEDRTLTVKQVLELYELGEFTREQAIDYLNKLGYPREVAEYKVVLYEHEALLKDAKERLNLLIEEYKAGVITWEKLVEEAAKLPFSATTIQRQLTKAYREKQAKIKLPSITTLKKWLKLNIITTDEFRDYLIRMGYTPEDADRFVKEVTTLNDLNQLTTGE